VQIAGSTRSLWDLPFPAACSQLQDLGFDKVEIWVSSQFEQLTPAQVINDTDSVLASFRDASRLSPVAIFVDDPLSSDEFGKVVQFAKSLRIGQITVPASPLGTPFNSEIDRLREYNHQCIEEGIRLSILTRTGLLTEDPHTATELCQSVKGLGVTLDPTYYVHTPRGEIDFDVVYPHVSHVQLRDSSATEVQVPAGLGNVDYNRIISSLRNEDYDRTLSVDLLPRTMTGEERLLELRKLRLLLESLL
jgi:sugar phosphate isomerase/epimerase